jgi:plastocyanin
MASHASRLIVGLAVLLLAFVAVPGPAAGADRTFTLYGDSSLGWGSTNTTIGNPVPALSVDLGDNVTLTLNASDGVQHNWFIDYDGDGNDDANEPVSPNFRNEQIVWNFTADRAGTFTYRCRFHPTTMTGNITIAAPGNGTAPTGDALPYVIAGGLFAVVVFIAIATVYMRRKKASPPPPPT